MGTRPVSGRSGLNRLRPTDPQGERAPERISRCVAITRRRIEGFCQKVGVPLKLANKTVNEAGDPLHFLLSVPGVETIERQELWPHYLSTMFPSYAAWSPITTDEATLP